jgi:DNA-binding MarR family transcriptional regulator
LPLKRNIIAYTIKLKASEIMQVTIDTVASECVAVRLRMLNRVVTNIYDDALRPLDLKVSQMNILVAAAKLGTARPIDVCEHLHLDVSTLSRNVERMKVRGWLEVVPDVDGRSQPFRLTLQGRMLLEKAIPAWSEAQHQVKKALGDGFVQQLNQTMKRVRKTVVSS